jgi:hypothetical protein
VMSPRITRMNANRFKREIGKISVGTCAENRRAWFFIVVRAGQLGADFP